MELILGHALGVGRDGGAFDTHAVFLNGLGRVVGHLVAGPVALRQAQVVILGLQVDEGQQQLVLDLLPQDAGHFVAVHLHDGRRHLNLFHGYLPVDELAAVDGRAQLIKFFLIARHNAHGAVPVQVAGQGADLQAAGLKLAQGPLKQARVVGLKMNLPADFQNTLVFPQEGAVGQAALGVFLAGPRVAEVEVDQVKLPVCEVFLQFGGVQRQKIDVFQAHFQRFFHAQQHGLLNALHGDKQDIRLSGGGLHGEFPLAAAHLQPYFPGLGHQGAPVAAKLLGVAEPDGTAGLHARL